MKSFIYSRATVGTESRIDFFQHGYCNSNKLSYLDTNMQQGGSLPYIGDDDNHHFEAQGVRFVFQDGVDPKTIDDLRNNSYVRFFSGTTYWLTMPMSLVEHYTFDPAYLLGSQQHFRVELHLSDEFVATKPFKIWCYLHGETSRRRHRKLQHCKEHPECGR